VAACSGLLFGFDIAVINGAIVFLRQEWALSETATEAAASSLLFGCVFGAALGGWLSDRFGRRRVLLFSALLFAFSALGTALPRTFAEFAAARFAGGLAIGVASLLAPLYIAEVSPAAMRGRLVALNQMTIVTGILLAYVINWMLAGAGTGNWRWMFAVAAVPAFLFLIALFYVPESPRWLVERGKEEEARQILTRISGPAAADADLPAIRAAIAEESGTFSEIFQPAMRKPLVLAIVLAVMQQWTGINTVLFYGSVILNEKVGGQSAADAIGANVLVGVVNFFATVVALWTIDRLGRRKLLILSAAALGLGQAGLAWAFLRPEPAAAVVIPLMLFCAAAFAVGLGPGVWVMLSEIFPNRIRGRAMGLATVSLWLACTVLTFTFLSICSVTGPSGAFSLYGLMCLFTVWFVARFAPETKGRSLEEIERFWKSASGRNV
jgi:SP family arabinose:H+ symporter-like MFS transporter